MANYTLRDVDDKLWRKVKILAINKQMTIQNMITELLKKAVADKPRQRD